MNSQTLSRNNWSTFALFMGGAFLLTKILPTAKRQDRFAKIDKKIRDMLAEEEKNTTPFPKAIDMEPNNE